MILASHGIIASQIASFDADAVAFFDRVTTAGGSLTLTEKQAVNTLVVDMKAYGIWTAMKAIYPMVGASAAACAQNLKSSSFTGTFSSGWTFASTGVKGNGSSAYFDTGLNVSSVLSGTNSHLSYYSRTIATASAGTDYYMMGAFDSVANAFYAIDMNDTNPNMFVALGSTTNANNVGVTNSRAFFLVKKETNNNQKAIRNSSILDTKTQTQTALPNFNMHLNVLRFTNGLYGYSPFECAFSSIGDGLTDTQASDLYTAVQAFQTTLCRAIAP